jgi:hypothetical protein
MALAQRRHERRANRVGLGLEREQRAAPLTRAIDGIAQALEACERQTLKQRIASNAVGKQAKERIGTIATIAAACHARDMHIACGGICVVCTRGSHKLTVAAIADVGAVRARRDAELGHWPSGIATNRALHHRFKVDSNCF